MRNQLFRGNTVYEKIPGYTGISRMFRWNSEGKKYDVPTRGKSYQAYRYVITNAKRSREAKMFFTINEALTWQADRNLVVSDETPDADQVKRKLHPTLIEVINFWKSQDTNIAVGTQIYYEKKLTLLSPLFDLKMDELSASHVDEILLEWKKRKPSKIRQSYDRELETLRFLIRWYVDNYDDAVNTSPIKSRHWKMSQLNVPKKFKRTFMEEWEYELFLQAVKEIGGSLWYTIALVQGRHFMRISETAAMKWRNLNFQRKSYLVCEHAIWPRIKGEGPSIQPGTKSRDVNEPFSIALFNDVMDALKELRENVRGDLIFTENGSLLTYRRIQHVYDTAFRKANLPFSGTHVLRHTGATLFQHYSEGDRLALQSLGGWKTSRQPEHYAKILSSTGRAAIDKIENKGKLVLHKRADGK